MTTQTTITDDTLVQQQNAAGDWAAARTLGASVWCGRPLRSLLSDAQLATLADGRRVRYDADWYANVRLARAERAVAPEPRPAFTCPTCGGHRDTTLAGRCDDCEA